MQLGLDFFFGGNAIFTVKSQVSGEHKTFKIRKTKPSPKYPIASFMLLVLVGNESYDYVGHVDDKNGALRLTTNSKREFTSPDVITFKWFMKHLFGDKVFSKAEIMHAGKCGRCGRTLTHPESLLTGIGPECAKKLSL